MEQPALEAVPCRHLLEESCGVLEEAIGKMTEIDFSPLVEEEIRFGDEMYAKPIQEANPQTIENCDQMDSKLLHHCTHMVEEEIRYGIERSRCLIE